MDSKLKLPSICSQSSLHYYKSVVEKADLMTEKVAR